MDRTVALHKKKKLIRALKNMRSVLVAFSGGVDSAFLLAAAQEALGSNVTAATAVSAIYPVREKNQARSFSLAGNISHEFFEFESLKIPGFSANPPDRCYHCKRALCRKLNDIAQKRKILHVVHGANGDDSKDYRPGARAALESGIGAPLADAGLGKEEIRFLAREMGLSQWDKPSMACLASRIPYGSPITEEKLHMIEAAEDFLRDRGVKNFRVRHHGAVARIEVSGREREQVLHDGFAHDIVNRFRSIGFSHIALDLEAFRSGSMNRVLESDRD